MTDPTTRPLDSLAARLDLPRERLALLEECDDADVAVLDDAVGLTILAEDRAIEDGLREAVRLVPRPLRGRARQLLFGGRDG